ncbi:uncharacterized protein V6R79_015941 [Siganus canaliculatus]
MAPTILQNAGFVLGVIGAAGLVAATAMNNWSVKNMQGQVVTSVYTYKGLWQDCETASSGLNECRPLYGLLGFSGSFQAVRALMVVGVVLSIIAAFISVFSLKCLKMAQTQDSTKAKMSLTAGVMFALAGVLGIAAASIYASSIVSSFKAATYNNYNNYGGSMDMGMGMGGGMGGGMAATTYTFGPALFVGWIAGGILLVAGILKSLAFRDMSKEDKASYPGVVYKPQNRTKVDVEDHHSDSSRKDQKYV